MTALNEPIGVPSAEAKQIQMRNRISQLEARERFLQKQIAQQRDMIRQTESSYHQLKQQKEGADRENENLLDVNI